MCYMRTSKNPKWPPGAQNGRRGQERGVLLGFWALPSTLAKQVLIRGAILLEMVVT